MKDFNNSTEEGNEKALRRGKVVPPDAVNVAWTKAPKLTPDKNVSIVDFSQLVPENFDTEDQQTQCRIMYANHAGILVDENANEIVRDEFPAVGDVFSIDEDFSLSDSEGVEYKERHIMAYLHVSRYFHVDTAGLTMPNTLTEPQANSGLRVVNEDGTEYLNEFGEKAYRIQIVQTNIESEDAEFDYKGFYRVHVYIDSEAAEGLYLKYFKVEYDSETGKASNFDINYREQLNPFRYYQYVPEESEVADYHFKRLRQYSTKPAGGKEQIVGGGVIPSINGYKVHVPKRAVPDPRIFQLFRWRLRCDFVDTYKTESITEDGPFMRVGVLHDPGYFESESPLMFYNLENSDINFRHFEFVNPLRAVGPTDFQKSDPGYWKVNIRSVSQADLDKFDLLVMSATAQAVDISPYYPKLANFVFRSGGTVLMDTGNSTVFTNMGFDFHSKAMRPNGSIYSSSPGSLSFTDADEDMDYGIGARSHDIFDGEAKLAGYDLNSVDPRLFSMRTQGYYSTTRLQLFADEDGDSFVRWKDLLQARERANDNMYHVFSIGEKQNNWDPAVGSFIYTTLGITGDCSKYFTSTGQIASDFVRDYAGRQSAAMVDISTRYDFLAEIYKLMYNICLYSISRKPTSVINDPTTTETLRVSRDIYSSTRWSGYTDWLPSWVIKGDVLFDEEKSESRFTLAPKQEGSTELVWQRRLSDKNLKQLMDSKIGPIAVSRLKDAQRYYYLESSNEGVEFPDIPLTHNTIPHAYTERFSPPFIIPPDLGAFRLMSERMEGLYADDSALTTTYPPRPYKFRVDSIALGSTNTSSESAIITVKGSATVTTKTTTPVTTKQTRLTWKTHGSGEAHQSAIYSHYNMYYPLGLHTWQYSNFNNTSLFGKGSLNWITPGILGRVRQGSTGIHVQFVQQMMNIFKFWGVFNPPYDNLNVDGVFGSSTYNTVVHFQKHFKQRNISGIVNAETYGVIASQIIRLKEFLNLSNPLPYEAWVREALNMCQLENISDGNPNTAWVKRTWSNEPNAPTTAWDMIAIQLDDTYDINTIGITPYTMNTSPSIRFESVHIIDTYGPQNLRDMLVNYDSTRGQYIHMKHRPAANQEFRLPIGPLRGNTVIVGIGQDLDSGHGGSRVFGVRDISAFAETKTGGQTTTATKTIPLTYTKTVTVQPGVDQFFTPVVNNSQVPSGSNATNIKWESVTSSNSQVSADLRSDGKVRVENTKSGGYTDMYKTGSIFPSQYSGYTYSMDIVGNLTYAPESGTIRKSDGLKIFCDRYRRPAWDQKAPSGTSGSTSSMETEYTEFAITRVDNDPTVTVGFYDFAQKEFIFDKDGISRITAIDLANRGRQNVFVAAIAEYEKIEDIPIPPDANSTLPYKWAMPVYGVCEKVNSRIGIEPLNPGLDKFDIWPVGIRVGMFARDVIIRNGEDGPLAGWPAEYRGKEVRAFYSIPEAEKSGWSPILGRPYVDIRDETPHILGRDKIQVRQAPIAITQEPTLYTGPYDPARPFFVVSVRASRSEAWRKLTWPEIEDYKVADGTIVLKNPIPGGVTEENVKVSYTTRTDVFSFKFSEGKRLNLNPYASVTESYINKPVYIYILPRLALDVDGELIPESVLSNTLRFTTDPSIFSPSHPEYSPVAVKLGVVYVNNGSDIRNLILLDTRSRGGGIPDYVDDSESLSEYTETANFWDISPGFGMSYQSGGFVVVRLPQETKEQFPTEEATEKIRELIDRWMPAGVSYRLERLDGSLWEE